MVVAMRARIFLVVVFCGVLLPPSNGLFNRLKHDFFKLASAAATENKRLVKLEADVAASQSRNKALDATVKELTKAVEQSGRNAESRSNRLLKIETALDQIVDQEKFDRLNSRVKHLETALTKINHQQSSFYREMDALNRDLEQVMVKQESLMDSHETESKEGPIADAVKEEKEEELEEKEEELESYIDEGNGDFYKGYADNYFDFEPYDE